MDIVQISEYPLSVHQILNHSVQGPQVYQQGAAQRSHQSQELHDLDVLVKDWTGGNEFNAFKTAIDIRATTLPILLPVTDDAVSSLPPPPSKSFEETTSTPPGWYINPVPRLTTTLPLFPANEQDPHPAGVSKRDQGT